MTAKVIAKIEAPVKNLHADDESTPIAHDKFKVHIICIGFGIALSIAVSYVPHVGPLAYGITGMPSLAQEIFDRIFRW